LGLYSCGNDEITTKQITQLTSIDRQIDSMQTILNEFDFDAIFHYSKEMADDKKAIKTNYHSDSVEVQLGRKVNRFNRIRKQFGKAASQGKMFHTKLEVQKTQTNKLLNDIKLGAGHKEKYQDYINLEIKNMQVLTEEFAELNKTTTRNLKEYKEINPFIKSFIEEIRKVD
jgi:hypothetical protein